MLAHRADVIKLVRDRKRRIVKRRLSRKAKFGKSTELPIPLESEQAAKQPIQAWVPTPEPLPTHWGATNVQLADEVVPPKPIQPIQPWTPSPVPLPANWGTSTMQVADEVVPPSQVLPGQPDVLDEQIIPQQPDFPIQPDVPAGELLLHGQAPRPCSFHMRSKQGCEDTRGTLPRHWDVNRKDITYKKISTPQLALPQPNVDAPCSPARVAPPQPARRDTSRLLAWVIPYMETQDAAYPDRESGEGTGEVDNDHTDDATYPGHQSIGGEGPGVEEEQTTTDTEGKIMPGSYPEVPESHELWDLMKLAWAYVPSYAQVRGWSQVFG
ncbi:hypothetical protein MMC10_002353 [Thelotrema lepadinum]|nr:hypothetical protein [Thelotrema lepadinum]